MSKKKLLIYAFLLFFIVAASAGCDKIPFLSKLSKYFPSLGEKKTPVATTAVAPAVQTPPPSAQPAMAANTLARVGNWAITKEEFKERLANLKEVIPDFKVDDLEAKKMVLEELIRQELLVQDAENSGVSQKKEIVDAVNEFRRTLLVQEVAVKLTADIKVTDAEAQQFYNERKQDLAEPLEYKIREIMVPTQPEASQLLVQILQGADFAATAQTSSKAQSASQGGDLGYVTEVRFPQMQSALSSLEVGATSSVFKGPDGYYIIKLEDKKGGQPKPFAEIREDLINALTLSKQQKALLDYIEGLKQKTSITVNEKLLEE